MHLNIRCLMAVGLAGFGTDPIQGYTAVPFLIVHNST